MKNGEKSFHKIFDIIELIATSGNGLKVREVSDRLAIPMSTAFRMMKFLVGHGYLSKQAQRYCLGVAMSRLGSIAMKQNSMIKTIHPILEQLADKTLETVHLGMLRQDQVVYVDKVDGVRSVRMGSMIGRSSPLFCTGIGKAILAFLPEEERQRIVSETEFIPYTAQTIDSADRLEKELSAIRAQHYAVDNCEHELGVYCIAAPVLDPDRHPLCALSISGSELYLRDKTQEYAALLNDAISEISDKVVYS